MSRTTNQPRIHFAALGACIIAFVLLFALPGGIPGYLICIAAFVTAVVIGHRAIRRTGNQLWIAVVALVLSYTGLIVSVGLFTVRLTRTFTA